MAKKIVVPAKIYSRVSGYYNPIDAFNKGKKEEYSERRKIKVPEDLYACKAIPDVP